MITMKKIISVALALVMVFALTMSVAAKDSPSAKGYYSITVSTEPADGSLGTADTDKAQVDKTATGSDAEVTLTAEETDGFFTLWIIEGDYEIVDGDLEYPELVIIPKSDIHAIASFSIEEEFLTMTAKAKGDGTATVSPASVPKGSNQLVTFTATDGKDTFTEWILECKYDIVEGSLKSRTLVIRPYTDVHGTAVFTSDGTSSNVSGGGSANTGTTSPKTGDPLFIIIGLAVLALGAGALAVKRIKE